MYNYTWEEAIKHLRTMPEHRDMIYDSYLTDNLVANVERYEQSDEFKAILQMVKEQQLPVTKVMDMPAGGGIATYAFAKNGYHVTAVDPDPSSELGRGAIAYVAEKKNLKDKIEIADAYGENLPFKDATFDFVFVRQGLHHAHDLNKMLKEIYRVLKSGGALLAVREPVVDDYAESLKAFLDSQVDHQLYGGENAFLLETYTGAIHGAGFTKLKVIETFDSIINMYPGYDAERFKNEALNARLGRLLKLFLPEQWVLKVMRKRFNSYKTPGRLHSFYAIK